MEDRKEKVLQKRQLLAGVTNFVAMFDGMVHFRDILKEAVEAEGMVATLQKEIAGLKAQRDKIERENTDRRSQFDKELEDRANRFEQEERHRKHALEKALGETTKIVEENRQKIEDLKIEHAEAIRSLEKHKQKVLQELKDGTEVAQKKREEAETAAEEAVKKRDDAERELDALYARLKR